MGSLNSVTIIGRLGADPELKFTQGGKAVCNLRVATSERMKDKTEKTEWHSVVIWGDQGENASKFLSKGREVCVQGRLETRQWEKDGVKRSKTEIVAHNVVYLGSAKGDDKPRDDGGGQARGPVTPPDDDSDVPF